MKDPLRYVLAYLFILSTWLDFGTTVVFMHGIPDPDMELNPIAAWFIRHHGFCGLGWAVIAADMFIVGSLLYATYKKRKTGLVGLATACLISNAVVIRNLVLLCQTVNQ